ncbi:HIT family protein [Geobacter sp. AOG2]|uniref:HIT family protein n=1 Tax=Geobacter sp. AOG2 TaxID=1566347 RepID=UPI001CC42850|nr:HIT family protein [Geobacter sp. AOG2]GFE62176.1 HIT family protein [Geobacter sp. AOG2]
MTLSPCPMCSRWESDADLRIAELDHSYVILNRDQFFPGYTLLFSKTHVTELFHLDRRVRSELTEEISRVAKALFDVFQPDKINYELLGNMVPHMHWHLVPRFTSEKAWPRPIWTEPHDERVLTPEEYRHSIARIREALT